MAKRVHLTFTSLSVVKDALSRTFLVHGIQVQGKLAVRGLNVWAAEDENQSEILLIRGQALGLPWSVIARELQQAGIQFKIVQLEAVFLVTNDNRQLRHVLSELNQRAKQERKFRIHVSGVGFAQARNRKRLDLRKLVLPALSVVGTLVVASIFPPSSQTRPQPTLAKTACASELPTSEFLNWLEDSLYKASKLSSNTNAVVQSEIGEIEFAFRQSIGTTSFVRAKVSCSDGTTKSYSFRTDSEANGVFALLEELDSKVG